MKTTCSRSYSNVMWPSSSHAFYFILGILILISSACHEPSQPTLELNEAYLRIGNDSPVIFDSIRVSASGLDSVGLIYFQMRIYEVQRSSNSEYMSLGPRFGGITQLSGDLSYSPHGHLGFAVDSLSISPGHYTLRIAADPIHFNHLRYNLKTDTIDNTLGVAFLRINNISSFQIDSVILRYPDDSLFFGAIPPGSSTDYRQPLHVYPIGHTRVFITGDTLLIWPIDYVGDPYIPGKYSYEFDITLDSSYVTHSRFIRDSP